MTKSAKYVSMRDTKLTEKAREIFGNIVVSASVLSWSSCYETEKEKKSELKKAAKHSVDEDEINFYDFNRIMIEFNNGKTVLFHASELGTISSFTDTFEEISE